MSDLTDHPTTGADRPPWLPDSPARWMVTFVGFPLGGFAATLLARSGRQPVLPRSSAA